MTISRQKEQEIEKKLSLIVEYEPVLDANAKIITFFKAERYLECGNAYQRAKDLYSTLEKSEIVQKIWSSVECSSQKVKDEIILNFKNERYSKEEIPILLVTLSLLGFPTDPLAFYLTDLKEKFDSLLCEGFSVKSFPLSLDDDFKLNKKLTHFLITEDYPELKRLLEGLEHSCLKEGVKIFHFLCEKVIFICNALMADFNGTENKRIAKMISGIPSERHRSISFLFEMFCSYFEEGIESFFQIQESFPHSLCKVQKSIDIFTHLSDNFVFLQENGEVFSKFLSLIEYFAGKATKYSIILLSTCPKYEDAEDWKMVSDFSSTQMFSVKFSLFLFLVKCICTFFSFGENQKENCTFYQKELLAKFNSISQWLTFRAEQCKKETLDVLKNSQIDLQEKKTFFISKQQTYSKMHFKLLLFC